MPPGEEIVAKLATAPRPPEMSTPNMPPEIRAAGSVGLPLTTVSNTPRPALEDDPGVALPLDRAEVLDRPEGRRGPARRYNAVIRRIDQGRPGDCYRVVRAVGEFEPGRVCVPLISRPMAVFLCVGGDHARFAEGHSATKRPPHRTLTRWPHRLWHVTLPHEEMQTKPFGEDLPVSYSRRAVASARRWSWRALSG